ncbi:MAG TPA: hypothetical protein VD815_11795 [Candidatus Saccharimonadales bacterium]|nr:hypothetical protein [Candidatus Saccharimonadales bacterium]
MNNNSLLLVLIPIIMKELFELRVIGILYFSFIMLYSTNVNFGVIYAQESSLDSLQNGLSQSVNSHNMTQMMQRGNLAMGFDQTKIAHEFSPTEDGGQIKIIALDENDNQTISQIRSHTRDIQSDFAEGNFTKPFFIHAESVPGTDAMTQNKDQIQYKIQDLKNGSILLLITNNTSLINSINEFMAYQSTEHKGH